MTDLRYAVRTLLKSPLYTLIVVLSLSLGIGANTAIFTLIDNLLLKPLPVTRPNELAVLSDAATRGQAGRYSYPDYIDLRDRNGEFSGVLARSHRVFQPAADLGRGSETVAAEFVSGNYFDVLGVRALVGRTLAPEDDRIPGNPVAVISHRLWQRRFGGERGVVRNLAGQHLGMDRRNVLQVALWFPDQDAYSTERWEQVFRRCIKQVEALPGVRSAALARVWGFLPGYSSGVPMKASVEGFEARSDDDMRVRGNAVTSHFFETLGIPVRRGRVWTDREEQDVAVVNEAFARRFLSGRDPIGRRVKVDWGDGYREIIGVVANARYGDLREAPPPLVYVSAAPEWWQWVMWVRVDADPGALVQAVRREIDNVDPNLGARTALPLEAMTARAVSRERMLAWLTSIFGLLAVVITAIGLYGLVSYAVLRRTREIGVRIALGATRGSVLRLLLRQVLALVAIGTATGIAAVAAGRLVETTLFGIGPADRAAIAGGAVFASATGILAGYIAAQTAARLDPMAALRRD